MSSHVAVNTLSGNGTGTPGSTAVSAGRFAFLPVRRVQILHIAGDVLGDAQSGGKSSLKLLRVVKDADMIADARTRAGQLLAADPELAGEVQLAGAVLDFTRGNETFLTSS